MIKHHIALHRSTLKRVKMHVATAGCERVAPLTLLSKDQPGGIGLFIVPCVSYISLFIVEILYDILHSMISELFAVWCDL